MISIGTLVDGKYKVLKEIGRGGMGVIWLAINERLDRTVAMKQIQKTGTDHDIVFTKSLIAELDILKSLSHPGLPTLYDFINTDDEFILVMTYFKGRPLTKLLQEQGAQPCKCVIDWAEQLCDILKFLHSWTPPFIYGDMKPANIILQENWRLALIDFGAASIYGVNDAVALGTRGYAAPEQYIPGIQVDARTDIYALGVTLHQLLTGEDPTKPPYELRPIRQCNPALPERLEWIIEKCTQRNPEDRFQSVHEVECALKACKTAPNFRVCKLISKSLSIWKRGWLWKRLKIEGYKPDDIIMPRIAEEYSLNDIKTNITGDLDLINYNAELIMRLQSDAENTED